MMSRSGTATWLTGVVCVIGLSLVFAASGSVQGAEEGPTVAFRAKASALPSQAAAVQGKAPEDTVEIILPGRVYDPPIKVVPVTAKADASWKTPEQASASDFSAFRQSDPDWLRENFTEEDYPQIKRMVEDRNMRRLNQSTYMNYGEKTILSRCVYKEFALVFARYDGAAATGVIEVYRKAKGNWKRTNALAKDEHVAVLLAMFRQGTFEQIGR